MEWEPTAFRPRGRPEMKLEDDKVRSKGCDNLSLEKQAESRKEWKRTMEQVRTLKRLYCLPKKEEEEEKATKKAKKKKKATKEEEKKKRRKRKKEKATM
jgi:hypothetical protein